MNQILNFEGHIRDPLHKTIGFTALEKAVFDTALFQRLRRIRQTAFTEYAFPGAHHTRFEHSLGSMHTAGLLLQSLIENQDRILRKSASAYSPTQNLFKDTLNALDILANSAYLQQCFRLAALLHDVGHPPLSHSGEPFLCPIPLFLKANPIPGFLTPWAHGLSTQTSANLKGKQRATHECYSILLTNQIFERLGASEYTEDVCALMGSHMEPRAGGPLDSSGLLHLLRSLISGECDVDRMDYLRRDAFYCGVNYGFYDFHRLLESFCFFKNQNGIIRLGLFENSLASFEDFLQARWSMYEQVYFHKMSTGCEAALGGVFDSLQDHHLPPALEAYCQVDDSNFCEFLTDLCPHGGDGDFLRLTLKNVFKNRIFWKCLWEDRTGENPPDPKLLEILKKQNIPHRFMGSSKDFTKRLMGREHPSMGLLWESPLGGRYSLKTLDNTAFYFSKPALSLKRLYVSRITKDLNPLNFNNLI